METRWLKLLSNQTRIGVVIQPIASIENHGVLPLGADLLIADCTMRRLELPEEAVIAPAIPYSTAAEHTGFRVSISPQTFVQYLVEVGSSILSNVNALLFVVFHGGAYHATYLAARILRSKGYEVYLFNFWDTVTRALGLEGMLIHADCIEASILLACGYTQGIREAERIDSSCTRRAPPYQPWVSRDIPGMYPVDPVLASRPLGEKLLQTATEQLRRLVDLILERQKASSQ
ncbi:creatininase family protein [Pyrodictium abyssi]|uniref:Creatininase family protein n=1 Tax=Pyrodictium abyssi TaxID=54256 RepID=A0ABM8IY42_9CREN|nr:hypothetical protein PABY_20280 [Pyrodictium abyssi]